MKIIRNSLNPAELVRLENAEAQAETNRANIDYIAMMTDVDIFDNDNMAGMEVGEDE